MNAWSAIICSAAETDWEELSKGQEVEIRAPSVRVRNHRAQEHHGLYMHSHAAKAPSGTKGRFHGYGVFLPNFKKGEEALASHMVGQPLSRFLLASSNKNVFGYLGMVYAMMSIGVLGFVV